MSAVKTILVPLTGDVPAPHVVSAALEIAKSFDGHVLGTDTTRDPQVYGGDLSIGINGPYYGELYKTAEKIIEHMRESAKSTFDGTCKKQSLTMTRQPTSHVGATYFWLPDKQRLDNPVLTVGRLSDLIVVDQPRSKVAFNETETLEASLFDTGRPVLMVPKHIDGFKPNHIAISWNGSKSVSKALSESLPLLEKVDSISIIQIGDIPTGNPDANLASDYLNWHGVKAVIHRVEHDGLSDGEALINTCEDIKADLVVMGAYARSPVREIIFGGMTRHMISHSKIPVFFSH
ncbi:MAG: universal stress protein [Rhodospirillaceae bacterium]